MSDVFNSVRVKGAGTAGTADPGVVTVQGIASGTAIPVTFTPSGTQDVNLKQVNGTTVLTGSGATGAGSERVTVAVDSATVAGSASLPSGTNVIGKAGIDQTTPGTTNRVAANVDQVNGATISAANPLFSSPVVAGAVVSSSNPLPVNIQGTVGTVVDSGQLTSASLAAGANVTVSATDITTGKTGKLLQAHVASSIPLKGEIQTFNGTTATTVRTFFTNSMGTQIINMADENLVTQAGGTSKHFQIKFTNMDNVNAADVYGSLSWTEV
jgi:hypothetical protein